jgi:hypothetical protein
MNEVREKCAYWIMDGLKSRRCARYAKRDDFCAQHHPDELLRRENDRASRFAAQYRKEINTLRMMGRVEWLRKRLPAAVQRVGDEILDNSKGPMRGALASEGWAGGYLAALRDIDNYLLCDGTQPRTRGYWDE